MGFGFDPLPEERGDLQPPRRRPPTAVGTMTLPPPSDEPPRTAWALLAEP